MSEHRVNSKHLMYGCFLPYWQLHRRHHYFARFHTSTCLSASCPAPSLTRVPRHGQKYTVAVDPASRRAEKLHLLPWLMRPSVDPLIPRVPVRTIPTTYIESVPISTMAFSLHQYFYTSHFTFLTYHDPSSSQRTPVRGRCFSFVSRRPSANLGAQEQP
jgi:hypothetical protein